MNLNNSFNVFLSPSTFQTPREQIEVQFLNLCKNGELEKIKSVVQENENSKISPDLINCVSKTKEKNSALHYACWKGDFNLVKYLLSFPSIKLNELNYESTPLHYCIARNHLEIAQLMLEKGASLKIKNIYGKTPFEKDSKISKEMFVLLNKFVLENENNFEKNLEKKLGEDFASCEESNEKLENFLIEINEKISKKNMKIQKLKKKREKLNFFKKKIELKMEENVKNKKQEEKKNISEQNDENTCCICLNSKRDCLFLPCRHNCACNNCAGSLEICPLCRTKITDKMKIYN